ncbi:MULTISPECIES: monovalent cation/H(+) antiporter subunit G [Oceanotoga]|jgi:multicomponent Na+:H+ antiporter subunit G|uniref:Multisubunit sodium/proton antiporter MrpG subunit n=1 Tax=Oceanotoga teriensis TaxID=515440 RepID=A0AA45C4R4_9BACT|nr:MULTISPECIES: monovalent cation/H(+) antiporter subunit G [Oceanotoga]MDN5343180.1 multicomponent Na+:H+ antiporter subunit [Oceanotoga sp.]MDO7977738.1 monovalent cation/H(+) antiporter subunit G [Oceanotoga teriensis]PWJ87147.1 multisubunit sodium/proton antiporter MrpG subunit [Oceanotoga teriensis]
MISNILFYLGMILIIIGTYGMIRMKDFYSRIQAVGISDTVGIFTILISLMIKNPEHISKLIIISILLLITSPVISHLLAFGASKSDIKVRGNKK